MGLALYPSEAASLEALMRLADADMYEHKKRRRCRERTETSPSADGRRVLRRVSLLYCSCEE